MALPLAGLKIVEIGTMIAVPAATYVLATQGAEVIKVEDTERGDELRHFGSRKNGMSGWFVNANDGKRSIALDLKSDKGKEVLWKLLEGADALIEGFRPGVLERLGFGYDAVSARVPKIVYCSSSGFGNTGPYANQPVYDPVIQCYAGMAATQDYGNGPRLVKSMLADKLTSVANAQLVTSGLLKAHRTGKGSYIQMSMLEANLGFNWSDLMMHCTLLDEDALHLPNILSSYRLFACTDGHIAMPLGTDALWHRACDALDRPDLKEDERFSSAAQRGANIAVWYEVMGEMVAPFSVEEAVSRLLAANVPTAPVLQPDEIADDPQVQARGLIQEVDHPVVGRMRRPRPSGCMFGEDVDLVPAPTHGQNTREILADLGFTEAEIEDLQKTKSVMTG